MIEGRRSELGATICRAALLRRWGACLSAQWRRRGGNGKKFSPSSAARPKARAQKVRLTGSRAMSTVLFGNTCFRRTSVQSSTLRGNSTVTRAIGTGFTWKNILFILPIAWWIICSETGVRNPGSALCIFFDVNRAEP